MLNERLTHLRELLHQPPDLSAWKVICEALDGWPSGTDLDVATRYIEDHQERWPDEYRVAPYKWVMRLLEPGFDARLRVVRTLVLEHKRLGGEVVNLARNLSEVPLAELELRYVPLGVEGFMALFGSAGLDKLRRLSIVCSRANNDVVVALSQTGWASTLQRLDLEEGDIDDEGVGILCEEIDFLQLEHLSLVANKIGNEGIGTILESPWMARLKTLRLDGNYCDDETALMIAECPRLGALERLELSGVRLTPEGYALLAEADNLSEKARAAFGWARR